MSAKTKYSDPRWRRLRKQVIREEPFCPGLPGDGHCDAPTTDVHHLDGLGLTGPRGYDRTNLQALCHPCHARITAREHGWGARPKRARPPQAHPGLLA